MPNILIVEDDININNLLCEVLRKAGYTCEQAFSGTEAKLLLDIKEKAYTLVLLDLMLPGASGEEVLKEIRKQGRLPVIVLTAKDSIDDKIGVLTDGADDYITKPFSLLVLISKVNACMRRTEKQSGQILISGDLEVHCHTMQVYRNRDAIVLSKKEIQLLICLMEHAGTVLTKEQILERVWDKDGQFVDDNTVTVNISRLKNKLDTNAIENIRGLGYIWTGTVTKK